MFTPKSLIAKPISRIFSESLVVNSQVEFSSAKKIPINVRDVERCSVTLGENVSVSERAPALQYFRGEMSGAEAALS